MEEGAVNISLCAFQDPYTTFRFVSIILSSVIAFVGVGTNLTLACVFIRISRKKHEDYQDSTISKEARTSWLYLIFLALLDASLCLGFFWVFGVDAVAIYFHIVPVFYVYFSTLVPVFVGCKIVSLAIPYFIIVATFEKWLWSYKTKYRTILSTMSSTGVRLIFSIGIAAFSLGLRLPSAWCFYVSEYPNCSDIFGTLQLSITDLAIKPFYHFLNFYIVNAFGVFIPFVVLMWLNAAIKRNIKLKRELSFLRKFSEKLPGFRPNEPKRQRRRPRRRSTRDTKIQEAMATMLVLLTIHLLCNTPHFILTFLEQFQAGILFTENQSSTMLYMIWSDVVSILKMLNSFSRMFIFYFCNKQIKKGFKELFSKKPVNDAEPVQLTEKIPPLVSRKSERIPTNEAKSAETKEIETQEVDVVSQSILEVSVISPSTQDIDHTFASMQEDDTVSPLTQEVDHSSISSQEDDSVFLTTSEVDHASTSTQDCDHMLASTVEVDHTSILSHEDGIVYLSTEEDDRTSTTTQENDRTSSTTQEDDIVSS